MSHDTRTVSERFQAVASRYPAQSALIFRDASGWSRWSYAELAARARALAHGLQGCGVRAGDAVGIVSARTPETIAAIIAILQTGAHYVPLDPAHPPARLRLLCTDAGVKLVLNGGSRPFDGSVLPGVAVRRVSDLASAAAGEVSVLPPTSRDTPAYVMFTSGSTGEPKGVLVPHRAIVRLVDSPNFIHLDDTRVFLHLAPLSFDASTLEIWAPLLNGGSCALFPDEQLPTAAALRTTIADTGVDCAWLTASLFNGFIDQDPTCLSALKEVLTGGEALSVPHVRRAQAAMPKTQLINGYGPTENTTFTACYRIPADFPPDRASVPIGQEISGTHVVIVDSQLRPVADGEEGELVATGLGVALGYLNKPALTAERFVPMLTGDGQTIGYRTGDRVVRRPDGLIDFLGRFDDQVKIEGHRIEPGEIERVITGMPGVAASRVLVLDSPAGQKRLAAYVVAPDLERQRGLRGALAQVLPAFMVPHFFLFLDTLPTNSNGKLDKARLPDPFASAAVRVATPSASPELDTVVAAWQHILGHGAFTEESNFFDAGGTSLDAVHLQELLTRRLGRSLEPTFVFEHPTTRRQAEALRGEPASIQPGMQRGQQRRAALARRAPGAR